MSAPARHASWLAAAMAAALVGDALAQDDRPALTAAQAAIYDTRAPQVAERRAAGVPRELDGLRGATIMLLFGSKGETTPLSVSAWLDHPDNAYAFGEQVRMFVLTSRDAYVTVIDIDASGHATLLFPNRFQRSNLVRGNAAVEVPDPGAGAAITFAKPGSRLIKVIASTQRVALFDPARLGEAGAYQTIGAAPGGIARDLARVMASWSWVAWDDYNMVVVAGPG